MLATPLPSPATSVTQTPSIVVDGMPVTPRAGKPVDVNALRIGALDVAGRLAPSADSRHRWSARADQAVVSFRTRFLRPDGPGLFDLVDGPARNDVSIRPKQLLAVSLPEAPLAPTSDAARAVLETCARELLTPLGLRSLSPHDPAYKPYHRGGPAARDSAYHQGTVWP